MSYFTEMDSYLFGQGTHYDIYRKLGAHVVSEKKKKGVCFDVWAPNASRVYVIGDFNGWNEQSCFMQRISDGGVYEVFVPNLKEFESAITNKTKAVIIILKDAL